MSKTYGILGFPPHSIIFSEHSYLGLGVGDVSPIVEGGGRRNRNSIVKGFVVIVENNCKTRKLWINSSFLPTQQFGCFCNYCISSSCRGRTSVLASSASSFLHVNPALITMPSVALVRSATSVCQHLPLNPPFSSSPLN